MNKIMIIFLYHDTTAKWNVIKNTIYNIAMFIFGKKPCHDWFNAHPQRMEPAVKARRELSLYTRDAQTN